jgi:NADH-quinone oxidoreductase subunit J
VEAIADMVVQNVFFGLIALLMVWAAIRVVTTANVVHAALWLVIVMSGIAAQYALLTAEFVAVTQVLVYVGAVMVLFIFGVMLTRAQIGKEGQLTSKQWPIAAGVALAIFGVVSYVVIDAFEDEELPTDQAPITTAQISDSIFGQYLLPFWALSILLTAALVGAIVLARRD